MTFPAKILSTAILLCLCGSAGAAIKGAVVDRATTLIQMHADAIHGSADDRFIARDAIVDADGTEHVRFDRTYRGLAVIGGDVVMHSRAGRYTGASLTLPAALYVQTQPKLTADNALMIAGSQFGPSFEGLPTAKLVVYAKGSKPVLAYEVLYRGFRKDTTPTAMHYYVDATKGTILAKWDSIETGILPGSGGGTPATPAVGSGRSLLSGSVVINTQLNNKIFELKDQTRGGAYTTDMANNTRGSGTLFIDGDNAWGNYALSDRATAAVDAHYGVATTWDYYKNIFHRNGIANDGVGALSRVHYSRNYVNAFWDDSCFCMTYGDGDGVNYNPVVMLDVVGHEMSHGVTSHTANLDYFGESGGLNEANSDMMGTMVEFYAATPAHPGNYMIGEKLVINNPTGNIALRYMFKPSLDGISPDCYPTDPDYLNFFSNSMDVHYTSGVGNHFYYLLAEGAVAPAGFGLTTADVVCNGNTGLHGVGRSAAQQIWYRALSVYMTSGTNYHGARAATLSAATDLFGATSPQHTAVAAAWAAVGVN